MQIAVAESAAHHERAYAEWPVRVFADDLFGSLTDTVTSQGVLAVFPFPDVATSPETTPFVLIADAIQDPGNLGTLIRSAAGAGATEVLVLPGTVDPWSPKTVRSAAAAHFLVPVSTVTWADLPSRLAPGTLLLAADASGTRTYDTCDLTGPLALVVGAEGSGLSAELRSLEPTLVSIPLAARLESLNAGVAGSVVLFEASRQRRKQRNSPKTPVSS